MFKLGDYFEKTGNEVQYFGMEHEGRCVGNRANAYTSDMDFHNGSKLSKITYPIKRFIPEKHVLKFEKFWMISFQMYVILIILIIN